MKVLRLIVSDRKLFPGIQQLILDSSCVTDEDGLQAQTWEITVSGTEDDVDNLMAKARKLGDESKLMLIPIIEYRLSFAVDEEATVDQIIAAATEAGLRSVTKDGASENGWKFFFRGGKEILARLQENLLSADLQGGHLA